MPSLDMSRNASTRVCDLPMIFFKNGKRLGTRAAGVHNGGYAHTKSKTVGRQCTETVAEIAVRREVPANT